MQADFCLAYRKSTFPMLLEEQLPMTTMTTAIRIPTCFIEQGVGRQPFSTQFNEALTPDMGDPIHSVIIGATTNTPQLVQRRPSADR